MTHLRQIMLEELRRRNYAESTIHAYIHIVLRGGFLQVAVSEAPSQAPRFDCLLCEMGASDTALRLLARLERGIVAMPASRPAIRNMVAIVQIGVRGGETAG